MDLNTINISTGHRNKKSSGHFYTDSLRQVSWLYVIWLLVEGGLAFSVYLMYKEEKAAAIHPSLLIYYLILISHIIFRISGKRSRNLLSTDLLFAFLYSLFHSGYLILFDCGFVPYMREIIFYEKSLPLAIFAINIGLLAFFFGFEITGPIGRIPHMALAKKPKKGWAVLGMVIMISGLSLHFSSMLFIGTDLFRKYGYDAVQNINRYTGYFHALLWSESVSLILLGLVLHLIGNALRENKLLTSKLSACLVIGLFLLFILEGNRGPILELGIPLLLIRHYLITPIKFKSMVVIVVSGLFLFAIIGVVRSVVFNPVKMYRSYEKYEETNNLSWTSPFVEMGGSFLILSIVCQDVPKKTPYWKGASWISAGIHAIPFLQGAAAKYGVVVISPSTWITTTYFGKNRAGRAFTVTGEGYLNFGLAGVLLELCFFGMMIRWFGVSFSRAPSAKRALIFFGCLVPALMVVRNHLNIVLNVWVQVVVVANLLELFLGYENNRFWRKLNRLSAEISSQTP